MTVQQKSPGRARPKAAPQTRRGLYPRPIPLHLAGPMMVYAASIGALPSLNAVLSGLKPKAAPTGPWSPDPAEFWRAWANGAAAAFDGSGLAANAAPFAGTAESAPFPTPVWAAFGLALQCGATAELLNSLGDLFGTGPTPIEALDLSDLLMAIDSRFRNDLTAMLDGIETYRRHPYARAVPEPAIVWREGASCLQYFNDGAHQGHGVSARPIALVTPSLINRAYILDLDSDTSFCRSLQAMGLDVFLLDWGAPGAEEKRFGLDEYIARLVRAIDAIAAFRADESQTPATMALVGYCMGGLLTLPAALQRPKTVRKLALLATPWDFHAEASPDPQAMLALTDALEPVLRTLDQLPVDIIQTLFAALDPLTAFRKFSRFAKVDADTPEARLFVALEDWLNDGVPMTAPVARETLGGWYGRNETAAGAWRIAGRIVDPGDFLGQAMAVIPAADKIVPPASALAITERLGDTRLIRPALGHIGMMSSERARDLWTRIGSFIAD